VLLRRLSFHNRDIAVGLVSYHPPASPEARQNGSFSSALRQKHKAMTFLGLRPAPTCFLHLPPGIKIGQRNPARYTRPKMTKAENWWQLR